MDKEQDNIKKKCKTCQYYDNGNNLCIIGKDTAICDFSKVICTDYLVNEKLIMF